MMTAQMTARELADRWRKSPEWVTEQARTKQIPGAWKLGRHWRFDQDQIEAYEQGQRSKSIFALTPRSRANQQKKKQAA